MSIVRVVGGPGTGKSTRLIDAAVAHIAGGGDPESVLLLTSARLAATTRGAITARLLNAGSGGLAVVREPLVRSVHSYAFGVLRNAAARAEFFQEVVCETFWKAFAEHLKQDARQIIDKDYT